MKWIMNFFKTETIEKVSGDIKDVKIVKYDVTKILVIVFVLGIIGISIIEIDKDLKELIILKWLELTGFLVMN
jgi:hypothetical protein